VVFYLIYVVMEFVFNDPIYLIFFITLSQYWVSIATILSILSIRFWSIMWRLLWFILMLLIKGLKMS